MKNTVSIAIVLVIVFGLLVITTMVLWSNNTLVETRDRSPQNEMTNNEIGNVSDMKIRLTAGDNVLTATLIDSETTRDFVSLLPITLEMNDLFSREKYGLLPRAISEGGERQSTYDVGDIMYYPPGPDLVIYYNQDGQSIPGGIIPIAKIDSGTEVFENYNGPVTIELIS